MGVVKNLFVRVGADVRGVVDGMGKAKGATSNAGRSIKKDTADTKKSVKETFEQGRKSVREYAEEVESTKSKHQSATADVERMTDKVNKMEDAYGTIVNATDGLDLSKPLKTQIADAEKNLETINGKIRKTEQALRDLGSSPTGKKAEKAAALRAELEDLIGQSDEAAEHLRQLDKAAERVGEENLDNASAAGLKKMQEEIEATKNRLNTAKKVAEETGKKLREMGVGVTAGEMWKAEAEKLKSAWSGVGTAFKETFSNAGAGFSRIGRGIKAIPANLLGLVTRGVTKLGEAITKLPEVPGYIASMIRKIGVTAIEVAGSGLKRLARGLAGLAVSGIKQLAQLPGRLLGIGRSASTGCGGLNKMVRSIRNIGVVSMGLRLAGGMFGRFRSIISSYISTNESLNASVESLKYQLGDALLPAINMVIGVMQRLMPVIQAVSNVINSIFSVLFGNLASTTEEIKKTAKEAGSAAKGLETYGFDQITKASDDSGGSGSTSPTTADQTDGQEGLVQKLTGWIQKLKDAFLAGDWQGLGRIVGEGINTVVSAIDGKAIGEKIGSFAQNLSTAMQSLLQTVDFAGIGQMAAAMLSSGLAQVDWSAMGQTIGTALMALPGVLVSFILNTDWTAVGSSLSSCIENVLRTVTQWIHSVDWLQIGQCIGDFIANVDWNGIAAGLFAFLGAALGATVATLWGCIDEAVLSIRDYFSGHIEDAGGDVGKGLLNGIVEGLGNIGSWIYDNIVSPFMYGLERTFPGFIQWCKTYILDPIVSGLFGGIKTGAVQAFESLWGGVKGWINQIIGGIELFVNAIVSGVNNLISGFNKIASIGEVIGLDLTISKLPKVSIPRLAVGGFVTDGTLAELGEQGKKEVVLPLERNTGWADLLVDRMNQAGSVSGSKQPMVVQVIVGGRKITEKVISDVNQITRETGVCPIHV